MMDQRTCPVCDSCNVILHFNIPTPYLDRRYRYDIYQCQQCGFQFADGPDDYETLLEIYSTNFHDSGQQFAPLDSKGRFSVQSETYPVIYNAIQRAKWLNGLGFKGRLLDVGAGRGYFVKAAESYFMAEGLDLSSKADEYAKQLGINLYSGDFLNFDYTDNRFDIITLWDVLASLRDPKKTIKHVHSLLNHNGILVMTLPRVSGRIPRLLGRYWPLWIPPVNLSYFSDKSIRILLLENGFEPLITECLPKRVSVSFLVTKLARTFGGSKLLLHLSSIIPPGWAIKLNLFDIMTVVAVKKG